MGSRFSNLHIRKNGLIEEDTIIEQLTQVMGAQQYLPTASNADADCALVILSEEASQWYSVYSDFLAFDDPEAYAELAKPLSSALHTDILGIACFDSDYLYLNLMNAEDETDAWLGIGSAAGLGIKRRSGLRPWKKKVADYKAFSEKAKGNYTFAEDFLSEIAHCLTLPEQISNASYEDLADMDGTQQIKYLYFKLSDGFKNHAPVQLVPGIYPKTPCCIGSRAVVEARNMGGASKGLSIYFSGPYVELDEITFSDVCFLVRKERSHEVIPIDLTKEQLPDGQWVYAYHAPNYRIPPKPDERLSARKRSRLEIEQSILIRFVPHGNPRKTLDITVAIVPDKHPEGQTCWNVWHPYGSKQAFIEDYNKTWEFFRKHSPSADLSHPLLREEDFD